ncbi:MAG: hypothetical protein HC933_22010 [Pleurocapsa sp. SU_196_0]|nr:hypothetical protein [Pleurocapsa sp. SU_196_0]
MGCQNRVVTAGLEALLTNVAQPFPKVRAALDGYGVMTVDERRERLLEALEILGEERKSAAQPVGTRQASPNSPSRDAAKTVTLERVPLAPDSEVSRLPLPVGGAKKLAQLGVKTVRDLLNYYPRRYEDRRKLPGFHTVEDALESRLSARLPAKPGTSRAKACSSSKRNSSTITAIAPARRGSTSRGSKKICAKAHGSSSPARQRNLGANWNCPWNILKPTMPTARASARIASSACTPSPKAFHRRSCAAAPWQSSRRSRR